MWGYFQQINKLKRINKIENFICILLIVTIIIFLFNYFKINKNREIKKFCNGYTVINYDSVTWCDGRDTLYNWHNHPYKVKLKND